MDGAAAMLAETWPSIGARDEAAKDLTGMLLRAGWDVEETDQFVTLVARIAGDEEWRKRAKAKHTAAKLAAGGHVTGARQLATRLQGDGEKVVALVQRWLNLPTPGRTRVSASGWPGRSTDARLPGRPGGFGGLGADEGMADLDEQVVSVSYNAVEVRRVAWLWEGRIPLGAITLLDGDPGLGKSLLTLDLAARITTGREMPDGTPGLREGAGVVLLSAEDDPGVTIAPRLRTAGADLARVEGVRGMTMRDPETGLSLPRSFLLPQDIPQLEEVIERVWARLVVIDPLMAYLDDRVNSWRDQDVRAALSLSAQIQFRPCPRRSSLRGSRPTQKE